MRPSPLRRHPALLVATAPLLAAVLLVGAVASWWPGEAGDTVRAVPVDGKLAVGSGGTAAVPGGPGGAHPVTHPAGSLEVRPAVDRGTSGGTDVSDRALPARVLLAYRSAAKAIGGSDPGCNLEWPLLAGIGKVESGHAFGGAVDDAGLTLRPILGPVLDGGPGVAAIRDSDGGRWDTDATWDRAVGPMQFIPTSWEVHGADGNGDGRRDPNNVADAALAAAGYLCAGDRDLAVERDRRAAVFSYNHSWDYVDLVLAWVEAYAAGTPVLTGDLPADAVAGQVSRAGDRDRRTGSAPPATAAPPAAPSPAAPATAGPPSPLPPTTTDTVIAAGGPDPPQSQATAPADLAAPSPDPGCPTPTPTPTTTGTATPTPTATGTTTQTPTPTPTPVDPTPTPTLTPTPTPTPTLTPTPTPTPTGPAPSTSCGPGGGG